MNAGKRLIFTVTSGRSGTQYLTHLLSGLPGIAATHEPAPIFNQLLPDARREPARAKQFLREQKLPFIFSLPQPVYIETSHYAAKGFFEPMLELGVVPDLILLRRSPRLIASSWFLIGVSMKKALAGKGYKHMLGVNEPNFLPATGWQAWHDYQLCYWYALETQFRMQHYAGLMQSRGGRVFDVALPELVAGGRYETLLDWVGAPEQAKAARLADTGYRARKVNEMLENKRAKGRAPQLHSLDLPALELQVHEDCALTEKLLQDGVLAEKLLVH